MMKEISLVVLLVQALATLELPKVPAHGLLQELAGLGMTLGGEETRESAGQGQEAEMAALGVEQSGVEELGLEAQLQRQAPEQPQASLQDQSLVS